MGRGMRFGTVDELPAGLREQARAALAQIPKPAPPVPMDAVEIRARQTAPTQLVSSGRRAGKTTAAALVADAAADLTGQPVLNLAAQPKRANKFGAVVTYVDGIRFDSKREAKYYEQLKLRVAAGEVEYFLRQVGIHLPGGTRLVVDFLEVHADGSLHYIDVKGRETPVFRLKKREVEHHYPITVELA